MLSLQDKMEVHWFGTAYNQKVRAYGNRLPVSALCVRMAPQNGGKRSHQASSSPLPSPRLGLTLLQEWRLELGMMVKPTIPTCRRLRQEDREFEARLSHKVEVWGVKGWREPLCRAMLT